MSKTDVTNLEEPLVTLENVYKVYDASGFAVRKVNLTIDRKEVVTLFGSNGAGKSTVAKLIANTIKQTSGVIEYNFIQPNIFYSIGFQSREQNWPNGFRTKDITNLWISIYNVKDQAWIEKLKLIFGVDKIWNRNLQKTSVVALQLFGVFLAMLYRPELLVIDELSSAIDFETKQEIVKLLNEYVKDGNTIIMVQPDEFFVSNLATRMLYISNGQIIDDETTTSVIDEYETVANYLQQNGGKDNFERKRRPSDLFKPILDEFNDLYSDLKSIYNHKFSNELNQFNDHFDVEIRNTYFEIEQLKNTLFDDARKPLINKEIFNTRKLIKKTIKSVDKLLTKLNKLIKVQIWPKEFLPKIKELFKSLTKFSNFLHKDLTNFYKHRRLLITGNSKLTRKQSEQLKELKEKYIREEMNTIRSERIKQSWQKAQTFISRPFNAKAKKGDQKPDKVDK